jgi:MFS transporter, DHA1 family, tetracycline resistance protein
LFLLVYSLFSFAFDGISSTSAIFVIEKFVAQTWQISLMLIMSGIAIAITNTFFVQRIVSKLGKRISVISSLFGLGISYVAIFFCPFMWLVYPLSMISSFMNSFIFPSLTTLRADLVKTQELETLMGVTSSAGSLMNILGPLCAGVMFDQVMVGRPYWMGTIIIVLAGVLMAGVSNRRRSEVKEINLIT